MNNEPTISEVLEAVNTLSTHVDERFAKIEANMVTKDYVDERFAKIEANMVTKDYLDDKLYDLRGDLVVLMRKEDKKVQSLVELLHAKKVISEKEAARILSIDLFPQVSL